MALFGRCIAWSGRREHHVLAVGTACAVPVRISAVRASQGGAILMSVSANFVLLLVSFIGVLLLVTKPVGIYILSTSDHL